MYHQLSFFRRNCACVPSIPLKPLFIARWCNFSFSLLKYLKLLYPYIYFYLLKQLLDSELFFFLEIVHKNLHFGVWKPLFWYEISQIHCLENLGSIQERQQFLNSGLVPRIVVISDFFRIWLSQITYFFVVVLIHFARRVVCYQV